MAKNANGLGSIYYDKGAKTWRGSITLGRDISGKLKRKTFTGKTQKIVKDKMDKFNAEFNTENYIIYSKMTLCDLIKIWYRRYVLTVGESTIRSRKGALIKLFNENEELKTLSVTDFTKDYIDKNLNSYLNKHTSAIDTLNLVLKFAIKNEYIKNDPLEVIKMTKNKKTVKKKRYMLNKAEQKRFLDETSKFLKVTNLYSKGYYYYPMLYFMYWTGLRIGERCALTWDSINFDNNTVTIDKTVTMDSNSSYYIKNSTKTNLDRTIPLHEEALRVLKFLREHLLYTGSEFVFPKKSNSYEFSTPNSARKALKRICENAGITPFSYHFLRHNFISMLLNSGASPVAVRELVGHESIKTTLDVYAHINNDILKDTIVII